MSKLTDSVDSLLEKIRESEAFQELKAKYEELDGQTKLYVNLGAISAVVGLIAISVLYGIAKVNGLKSEINEREELIGYLQRSADTIKQLKAQQTAQRGNIDMSSPLNSFVDSIVGQSELDRSKIEIAGERTGTQDKETIEVLVDIKMNQVNLKQLVQVLFRLTDQGAPRNLNIKDLNVDTKNDPTGYIDVSFTVASFKAK